MHRLLLYCFVYLHNFSYKVISKLAIVENNGSHPKHRILGYHDFFKRYIDPMDKVIDIGCGTGENAFDIAEKTQKVIGIDINQKNIIYAKKHFVRGNLEFIASDVTTCQFGQRFDKIVFSNVLEHIENRIDFLKKLHAVSDTILLRVPMLDRDWIVLYKKEHGLEYRLDKTHYIEYTLPILRNELEKSGWNIQEYSIQFGEFWGVIKTSI
ncbi:MAG: class I SAM-dependent methyltransferase [Candidatus Magasanikbacteria bacterium]